MAQVFISYARADESAAQGVAAALQALGFETWWDRKLLPHLSYTEVIEERLRSASAVLVLWSATSVRSDWVRAEADLARQAGKLVQARLDDCDLPLPFGQTHCSVLQSGLVGTHGWDQVVESIKAILAPSGSRPQVDPARGQTPRPAAPRTADAPSIAVMPFRWRGANDSDSWFAEAVAEDIIGGLSRGKQVRVVSRQSSFSASLRDAPIAEIGSLLSVTYVLQGGVVWAGRTIRLNVELAEVDTGKVVWSTRYDRSIDDLFEVQDDIAARVCSTLDPVLMSYEQSRVREDRHASVEQWTLYVKGRSAFWDGTRRSSSEAKALLRQALSLRPGDVSTLCMLSLCLLGEIWAGWTSDPLATLREATECARLAVRNDPADARSHNALGYALSLTGNLEASLQEQLRAIELNPFFAAAIGEVGRLHAFSGRAAEALPFLDRAIELSPLDPQLNLFHRAKGIAYFCQGDFAQAADCARTACAERPDFFFHHLLLAACLAEDGELTEAADAYRAGASHLPHYPLEILKFGHPFARAEDMDRFLHGLTLAGWQG